MSYMDNPSPRRQHRTRITRQTCPGLSRLAADHGGRAPCGRRDTHGKHPIGKRAA